MAVPVRHWNTQKSKSPKDTLQPFIEIDGGRLPSGFTQFYRVSYIRVSGETLVLRTTNESFVSSKFKNPNTYALVSKTQTQRRYKYKHRQAPYNAPATILENKPHTHQLTAFKDVSSNSASCTVTYTTQKQAT